MSPQQASRQRYQQSQPPNVLCQYMESNVVVEYNSKVDKNHGVIYSDWCLLSQSKEVMSCGARRTQWVRVDSTNNNNSGPSWKIEKMKFAGQGKIISDNRPVITPTPVSPYAVTPPLSNLPIIPKQPDNTPKPTPTTTTTTTTPNPTLEVKDGESKVDVLKRGEKDSKTVEISISTAPSDSMVQLYRLGGPFKDLPSCLLIGAFGKDKTSVIWSRVVAAKQLKFSMPVQFRLGLYDKVNQELSRIARMTSAQKAHIRAPPSCPQSMVDRWLWTTHVQICTQVQTGLDEHEAEKHTLFYHSLLFDPRRNKNGLSSNGGAKFPLVGAFVPFSGITKKDKPTTDYDLAQTHLRVTSQHLYPGEGDKWIFGADNSTLHVELRFPIASFWAVCIDVEAQWVDCTYMMIIAPSLEEWADRIFRAPTDESYVEFYTALPHELARQKSPWNGHECTHELTNILFS